MDNYEKICSIINAGHIAQVEYEDWKFEIFSCVTSEWYVRGSDTYGSSKDCYDALWTYLYSDIIWYIDYQSLPLQINYWSPSDIDFIYNLIFKEDENNNN